ncbi:MAG: hypothetical protein KatS3mg077_1118 [Candidatus Binatia bacterium]|nr:MAG: hypothetical protein KatS3mg077_1118 [Candidatus Binatia bacterium]
MPIRTWHGLKHAFLYAGVYGLVALAFLEFSSGLAWATTAIITGTEWVFVRRGPGNQFPPFARIPSGSTVEVQEVRDDWAQIITASGQVGFIHVRFLSFPEQPQRYMSTPTPLSTPHSRVAPPSPAVRASPTSLPPTRETAPPAPTRTPTSTRTFRPTRTPRPTRSPTPTRTLTATRSPSPTRTSSPTRTAAMPGARTEAPIETPLKSAPSASPSPTGIGVYDATQEKIRDIEAELLATRQELASCRQQNASASLSSCPHELREELMRLRAAIERDRSGEGVTAALSDTPQDVGQASSDNHVITPFMVFLAVFGFVIGWIGGSRYTRRVEQRRRWRLRF